MTRDMASRELFYAQAALTVECGACTDDEIVERILTFLRECEVR